MSKHKPHNKPVSAKSKAGEKPISKKPEKKLSIWQRAVSLPPAAVITVVVIAVTFAMLLLFYGNFMRKIEGLSIFLPTSTFFSQNMAVPGGLLTWLSAFFTQFMLFPVAGAINYAVLLASISLLAIKAFKLPGTLKYLSLTLWALLLLSFTNLGYLIFSLKPVGFAFILPLGILVALVIFLTYRIVSRSKGIIGALASSFYILAVVIVGYPLFGFYALLAAAMCALYGIGRPCWRYATIIAMTGAVIVIWPKWWFYHVGGDLILSQTYISGLPRFYSHEIGWKILYSTIFLLMLGGAALSGRWKIPTSKILKKIPAVAAIASVVCVFTLRNSDSNLNTTLALDHALWQQDWSEAVRIAEEMQDDPTRVNTVLSYIAMMRTGQAAERMFGIIDSKAPYNTTRAASAFNDIAGALAAYHLGLLNYSYRWATEYTIGQGLSVERLKLMTKIALLNYELDLAGKYLDILYNTPFHREWAKKYMRYKQNPSLMASDPEFASIIPLLCNPNEFINDGGGAFESYVWKMLAAGEGGTPQYVDLTLQAALINRDLDRFITRLADYHPASPRIPRYYQEAALLWSIMSKQPSPIPIDQTVVESHNRFLEAFRASSLYEAEQQREVMRGRFGKTYWFYNIFNDDMLLK